MKGWDYARCAWKDCGSAEVTASTWMGWGTMYWCAIHADMLIKRLPANPPQPLTVAPASAEPGGAPHEH